MTHVKMKANDTLHISALGPDSLRPGEEFEVSDDVAKDLEARGLAKRVRAAKAAAAPANKAAPAPKNKSLGQKAAAIAKKVLG